MQALSLQSQINGKSVTYFKDGQILKEEGYKNGKCEGTYKEYYDNGKLKGWFIFSQWVGQQLKEEKNYISQTSSKACL